MDYETRLLEEKQGGKEEATISGLKKLISALRDFGAPFFVINNKYAISGAQPYEVFVQALEKVKAEEK